MNLFRLEIAFWGDLITNSVYLIVYLLFHVGQVIVACIFQGVGPFHLICQIMYVELVCKIVFILMSLILIICVLYFFSFAQEIANYIDLSQSQLFIIDFYLFFFYQHLHSFNSVINFLLLALSLFCFGFYRFLRWEFMLLKTLLLESVPQILIYFIYCDLA